jgi:hypothetical protein
VPGARGRPQGRRGVIRVSPRETCHVRGDGVRPVRARQGRGRRP